MLFLEAFLIRLDDRPGESPVKVPQRSAVEGLGDHPLQKAKKPAKRKKSEL